MMAKAVENYVCGQGHMFKLHTSLGSSYFTPEMPPHLVGVRVCPDCLRKFFQKSKMVLRKEECDGDSVESSSDG